ncbi:MAG: lysylphosphatidylglycerol synthase transmembrane domain-containing protein [Ignavibacteriaceae bacterium]
MHSKVLSVKSHFVEKRNFYSLLGKVIITAGLITFIITKINFSQAAAGIKGADSFYIVLCCMFMFLNIYLQYLKWKLACIKILNIYDRKKIFNSLFFGFAGGAFTPARLGEYWGRSIALKDKPFLLVSAATIIDKIFPLIIIIISGIIFSIPFMILITGNQNPGYVYALSIIFALVSLILFGVFFKIKPEKIYSFIEKTRFVKKHPELMGIIRAPDKKFFSKMLLISMTVYGCYIFQYALLTIAFSDNQHILKYMWAGILVMFTKAVLVPFSLTELGIREGASAYFLSLLGESAAAGFNAALFLFLINIIVPSLFGLLLMLTRKNGK